MCPIEKKVLFGTKQEAFITPKEGYQVVDVEVFNKTTNEIVPSQLTRTSDNPPQWTCSFVQPAGVVAIHPKMEPVSYSVIIEECEYCSIVLLECNDVVDVKLSAVNNAIGEQKTDSEPPAETSSEVEPKDEGLESQEPNDEATAEEGDDSEDSVESNEANDEHKEASSDEDSVNFTNPQLPDAAQDSADEASNVEVRQEGTEEVSSQDRAYSAGEFESELEEESTVISRAEYDKKNESFWAHRKAFYAGDISEEKFNEVKKKHMQFTDDISSGKITVQ